MPITGDWDQRITRRTLLRTGGSFAAGITLAGTLAARASAQASFASDPFALGVASGDPTAHGMVLWTRIAPEPLAVGGGLPAEPYRVRYELARDEDFRHIVRHGDVLAVPDEAHSVRVELDQLPPAHEYFYRFEVGGCGQPRRPHAHRPAGQRRAPGAAPVRVRVVPELPGRVLRVLRRDRRRDGHRDRHLPRRLHLRGLELRRPRPRAAAQHHDARRLPDPARPVQDRRRSAGGACRASVARDLGRPRVRQQLRGHGPRSRPGSRGRRGPPRRRLPCLLGAHAALARAQAGRAGPAALPALHLGVDRHLQRPRRPPVPLRPAGLQATSRATPTATARAPRPPSAACSAPSSATGC